MYKELKLTKNVQYAVYLKCNDKNYSVCWFRDDIWHVYFVPFQKPKPKISASRRLFLKVNLCLPQQMILGDYSLTLLITFYCVILCMLQTKLLKKAMTMLENDKQIKKDDRERILSERVPALQLSGLSLQELQVCWPLHHWNLLKFICCWL